MNLFKGILERSVLLGSLQKRVLVPKILLYDIRIATHERGNIFKCKCGYSVVPICLH